MLSNVSIEIIVFTVIFWVISMIITICQIGQLSKQKKWREQERKRLLNDPDLCQKIFSRAEKASENMKQKSSLSDEENTDTETTMITVVQRNQKKYFLQIQFSQIDGNTSEWKVDIDKSAVSIGRSEKCDISIQDAKVSRYHVDIVFEDGKIYIRDNDSTNGTYVNKQPIMKNEKIELPEGTIVSIGDTKFQVYKLENVA